MKQPERVACAEVLLQLDDYLDRELSSAAIRRVEDHLAICTVCAPAVRFEAAMVAGLRRKLRSVQVPAGLAARLHEGLQKLPAPGAGTGPES